MKQLRYHSAISWPLAAFLFGVMGAVTLIFMLQGSILACSVFGAIILFMLHMYFTTYYVITDDRLVIRCGFLFYQRIPIDSILSITASNDLTSAPALSLKRLLVRHSKGEVMISPKHRVAFLNALIDRGALIKMQPFV